MGMTNEITLFTDKSDTKKILKILKNIKINDKSLLRVELIKKKQKF